LSKFIVKGNEMDVSTLGELPRLSVIYFSIKKKLCKITLSAIFFRKKFINLQYNTFYSSLNKQKYEFYTFVRFLYIDKCLQMIDTFIQISCFKYFDDIGLQPTEISGFTEHE